MKSKENKKSVFGSYLVILLILLVGLSSLYSMVRFNENSRANVEISEFIRDTDGVIRDILLLINTDSLEEYNRIKGDIEFEMVEIALLHKRIDPSLEKFNQRENFGNNLNTFIEISDALIKIQNSTIIDNNEFIAKKGEEKSLRHALRSNVSDNLQLLSDSWRMGYYSKETLYQYRDEKHLNEWLESIEDFKDHVRNFGLQQELEDELLEKSGSYEIVALEMGDIVLRQVKSEEDKRLKIQELEKLVGELEEDSKEISKEIRSETNSLSRNTFLIIIGITILGAILLFASQRVPVSGVRKRK